MRNALTPGLNVDRVDVPAGMAKAAALGYDDAKSQMVAEYTLMRWKRGEEDGAQKTWLAEFRSDLTSFFVIIAHAVAVAEANHA